MNKLYIYGTGKIADKITDSGLNEEVSAYIETKSEKKTFRDKPVLSIDDTTIKKDDIVIVANNYCNEIVPELLKRCESNQIISWYPVKGYDAKKNIEIAESVLGIINYTGYCDNHKLTRYSFYQKDREKYEKINKNSKYALVEKYDYPIIRDKYSNSGSIDDSFYESLWFGKKFLQNIPSVHYDIGSKINGILQFPVAANVPLKVIDVREFPLKLEGLDFVMDDAKEMNNVRDNSIESLSAFYSVGHIGLGRYGDEIDPEGHVKCINKIQSKLKVGGNLYISFPISGNDRVHFNAHRVFRAQTIVELFGQLNLREFAYVINGKYVENARINDLDTMDDTKMAMGFFWFVRE